MIDLPLISGQSDLNRIRIGSASCFADDEWNLSEFMEYCHTPRCYKLVKFSHIQSVEMKQTLKQYAYYKLGRVKPRSVITLINGTLPSFVRYADNVGVTSFADVTLETLEGYAKFMKEEYITEKRGEKVAPITVQRTLGVLHEIIRVGQLKGWNVPKGGIPIRVEPARAQRDKDSSDRRYPPIPEDVLEQVLDAALHREPNTATASGIIVMSQTGIRVNELLSVKSGCMKKYLDRPVLEVALAKVERGEPVKHLVQCNDAAVAAIENLTIATAELRKACGRPELFLSPGPLNKGPIDVLTTHAFNLRLKRFVQKHDIRNKKGNLYTKLHSHQFRTTWATQAGTRGIPLQAIQRQLAHETLEMTSQYVQTTQKEVRRVYAERLFHPTSKLAGRRADQIKKNILRMCQGNSVQEIDNIIQNISDSLDFQPLPMGICLYDERRARCTDGDGCYIFNCVNFVTESRFLPVLKKEMALYEQKMTRSHERGHGRDFQRAKKIFDTIKPIVRELEASP